MSEHELHRQVEANFAVLTISDSRTEETDLSGKKAQDLILQEGHQVLTYKVVPNDQDQIQTVIKDLTSNPEIDVIFTTGGTGISHRDLTVETVSPLLDKEMEGFGELFRRLSYQEIGEAAMISRATAGTIQDKIIFCLPGSKNAVKLALTKLILPGIGHILEEARR
ncbi:MAG: MogA/MoaB family molybdenum cofactor biosynthesis protein [Thermoproteota archaeon]